jgi:hypothetical protein
MTVTHIRTVSTAPRAVKEHKLTWPMVKMLAAGEAAGYVLGNVNTIVALIDRGLVTTGQRNLITDTGRKVLAELQGTKTELVTAQDARAEVDSAMIGPTRKDVPRMSSAGGHSTLYYRDGRCVQIRPATPEEIAEHTAPATPEKLAPEWRTFKGVKSGNTVLLWKGNRKTGPEGEPREVAVTFEYGGWRIVRPDGPNWFIGGAASKHWWTAA